MKKILFILPFCFLLTVACKNSAKKNDEVKSPNVVQNKDAPVQKIGNGTEFATAIQYNDFIVNKQTAVAKLIMQFADDSKTDLNKANETIDEAVIKVDQTISDIKDMPDWEGNTDLRDKALSLFGFYKTIFSSDYRRIIAMKKDDVISPKELTEYNQIMQRLTSDEAKVDGDFKTAQSEFAAKNGFGVATNELQEKIDKMKKGE